MISIDSASPTPAPRPRRTVMGAALRTFVWGLVVALMAVVGTFAWESGRNAAPRRITTPKVSGAPAPAPRAASADSPAPGPSASKPRDTRRPVGSSENAELTSPLQPLEPDSPSDRTVFASRLERLEEGVVKIETGEAEQIDTLGSGFVVDRRGLVATSYHVVAEAVNARVRFKHGAAYDVVGYAAVDPQTDLAILTLRDYPKDLVALELIELDPSRLSAVVALGHPRGLEYSLYEGKVSRVVTTAARCATATTRYGRSPRQSLPPAQFYLSVPGRGVSQGDSLAGGWTARVERAYCCGRVPRADAGRRPALLCIFGTIPCRMRMRMRMTNRSRTK